MSKIAVIVPVLNRPERVEPLVKSFHASCTREQASLFFIAQQNDVNEIEALRRLPLIIDDPSLVKPRIACVFVIQEKRSWAKKINVGLHTSTSPWILCGADDLNFIPGWVEALEPYMADEGAGVIGTSDLGQASFVRKSCHPLVRRAYAIAEGTIDERNKVVHEGYDHNFPDTEMELTAIKRGAYRFASECVIEHLHPLTGKAKIDDTYRLGSLHHMEDSTLFAKRIAQFGLGSGMEVLG